MIVLPPDGQILCRDDWQLVTRLLLDESLQSIGLVEVFALSHSRQLRSEFRVLPIPLSLHAVIADARCAAEGLRQRGRAFVIERLPAMQLNFGRYSLMLVLRSPRDYAGFTRLPAKIEGNVIRVASFALPNIFIGALSFRELDSVLSSRLLPGQMLYGCMGFAVTQAGWTEWHLQADERWVSMTLHGEMYWLKTDSLLVSTDFAVPFVRQAQSDLNHLFISSAEHWF